MAQYLPVSTDDADDDESTAQVAPTVSRRDVRMEVVSQRGGAEQQR